MPDINRTVGFLGCGNMAECIMNGMLSAGMVPPEKVYVCNRTASTVKRLTDTYGVNSATATELAKKCDIIFLGVKPYGITAMLDVIKGDLTTDKVVVSMAAGVVLDTMEKHVPAGQPLVRVMPNVPSRVGCGFTSVTPNKHAKDTDTTLVVRIFEGIGKASVVSESAIHGVVGVAGSSPAYTFMFLEALADGAVRGGLSRAQANEAAAQAVMGAAKMMLETGMEPGALKSFVCSPAGTTIEAVRVLEKNGLRSAVMEGVIAAMEKSKQMDDMYRE